MPVISIRISEDLKSRLEALAQESGSTTSDVIVEALSSVTGMGGDGHPEEIAPDTIDGASRLMRRSAELLLARCDGIDDDERERHARNARILENGFTGEYHRVFASLRPEIPRSLSSELFDILDMFRVLRASYSRLGDDEKDQVSEGSVSFRGFDSGDGEGSQLTDYVEYLFETGRYIELEEPMRRFSDGGGPHRRDIDTYRRMYSCYKHILRRHPHGDLRLSMEEMRRIVSAGMECN